MSDWIDDVLGGAQQTGGGKKKRAGDWLDEALSGVSPEHVRSYYDNTGEGGWAAAFMRGVNLGQRDIALLGGETGISGLKGFAEEAARQTREAQAYRMSPEEKRLAQEYDKLKEAGETVAFLLRNPSFTGKMAVQSVGQMLPTVFGAAGSGAAAGAGIGSVVPGAGTAAGAIVGGLGGAALGSGFQKYSEVLFDKLAEAGVDLTDPQEIERKMRDSAFMEKVRANALKQGIAVGIVDAATSLLGLKGAGGIIVKGGEKLLGKQVASEGARKALETGAMTGVEMAGGATGEALAQYAGEGKVNMRDVVTEGLLEAFVGGPQAVAEVAYANMQRGAPVNLPVPAEDVLGPVPDGDQTEAEGGVPAAGSQQPEQAATKPHPAPEQPVPEQHAEQATGQQQQATQEQRFVADAQGNDIATFYDEDVAAAQPYEGEELQAAFEEFDNAHERGDAVAVVRKGADGEWRVVDASTYGKNIGNAVMRSSPAEMYGVMKAYRQLGGDVRLVILPQDVVRNSMDGMALSEELVRKAVPKHDVVRYLASRHLGGIPWQTSAPIELARRQKGAYAGYGHEMPDFIRRNIGKLNFVPNMGAALQMPPDERSVVVRAMERGYRATTETGQAVLQRAIDFIKTTQPTAAPEAEAQALELERDLARAIDVGDIELADPDLVGTSIPTTVRKPGAPDDYVEPRITRMPSTRSPHIYGPRPGRAFGNMKRGETQIRIGDKRRKELAEHVIGMFRTIDKNTAIMVRTAPSRASFRGKVYFTANNEAVISIRADTDEAQFISTLAHELGHVIAATSLWRAPLEMQAKLWGSYLVWRGMVRARLDLMSQEVSLPSSQESLAKEDDYYLSFAEWFAREIQKWALTDRVPVSKLEKFVNDITEKVVRFFAKLLRIRVQDKVELSRVVADWANAAIDGRDNVAWDSMWRADFEATSSAEFDAVRQRQMHAISDITGQYIYDGKNPVGETHKGKKLNLNSAVAHLREFAGILESNAGLDITPDLDVAIGDVIFYIEEGIKNFRKNSSAAEEAFREGLDTINRIISEISERSTRIDISPGEIEFIDAVNGYAQSLQRVAEAVGHKGIDINSIEQVIIGGPKPSRWFVQPSFSKDEGEPVVPLHHVAAQVRQSIERFTDRETAVRWSDYMSRFTAWHKWTLGIKQVAHLWQDIRPLQDYASFLDMMDAEMNTIMGEADIIRRDWAKLPLAEQDRLGEVLFELSFRRNVPPDKEKAFVEANLEPETQAVYWRVRENMRNVIRRYHALMVEEANRLTDPQARAEALQRADEFLQKHVNSTYFPFMRFGKYTVTVRRLITLRDGSIKAVTVHFETFETEREQKRMARELENMYPGHEVSLSKMPDEVAHFAGVPPQVLADLRNMPGLTDAQRDWIDRFIIEHSPGTQFQRKHFLRRKKTPGWSMDAMRTFAAYNFFHARHYARSKYSDRMRAAIKELEASTKLPGDHTELAKLTDYMRDHLNNVVLNAADDWALLRSVIAVWHLGFVPKAAVVNLSQLPLATYPWLADRFGQTDAIRFMTRNAVRMQNLMKVKTLEEQANVVSDIEVKALAQAAKDGIITESLAVELAAASATSMERMLASDMSRAWLAFSDKAMWLFQLAEQYNRRVAFMSAFEAARERLMSGMGAKGLDEAQRKHGQFINELIAEGWQPYDAIAYVVAKEAVEATQFKYSRLYRPRFMRGRNAVVFTFFMFTRSLSFMLANRHNRGLLKTFIPTMLLLAGPMGLLPDELEDILDMWLKKQYGESLEMRARKLMKDLLGEDSGVPYDLLLHGVSRYSFGLPQLAQMVGFGAVPNTDLSASIGLSYMVPYLPITQLAKANMAGEDWPRTVAETAKNVGGIPASMLSNVLQATFDNSLNVDDPKRWERVMPVFMKNAVRSYRWATEGMERTRAGTPVVEFDTSDTRELAEIIAGALGFYPTRVKQAYERNAMMWEVQRHWRVRRGIIYHRAFEAYESKDKKMWDAVMEEIRAYNKEVPYPKFRITSKSLKRSLKARARRKAGDWGIKPGIMVEIHDLFPEAPPHPLMKRRSIPAVGG